MTNFKTSRIRCEQGQSTLEFALTLLLLLSFVLGFIQLSLVFGYANFVHYATFMAARAQQSAGLNADDQFRRSRDVIVKLLKRAESQPNLDRWPTLGKAVGNGEIKGTQLADDPRFSTDPATNWLQGVRYTFRSRLFMIPVGGDQSTNEITLTSESWLGREPNYEDCMSQGFGGERLIDNGC
jgi:hypothetical protein